MFQKTQNISDLFDKKLKTPSGIFISEVDLIHFFTMLSKLQLIDNDTAYNAFIRFSDQLERTK